MVGLTVILAASTAILVLDFGEATTEATPTVGWSYEYTEGDVQATHISGNDVEKQSLTVHGSCASSISGSGTVDGGTTLTIGRNCSASGESLTIVWQNETTGKSAIIGRFSN